MLTLQYLILGIIQGITEPLPVSSSGHLILAKAIFGVETAGGAVFELVVHAGSLIAILFFYKTDFIKLFFGFFKQLPEFIKRTQKKESSNDLQEFHYGMKLILATIPAGLIGILFKKQITSILSTPLSVGVCLIVTGTLLSIAYNATTKKGKNSEPTYRSAFIIGISQALALLPGISRSGTTNATGLIIGYDIKQTMKFAFFMFIPIALVAILSGIPDLLALSNLGQVAFPLLVAFIASTITTYFAMRLLLKVLQARKLNYFAYYCFFVGTLTLIISIGTLIFK